MTYRRWFWWLALALCTATPAAIYAVVQATTEDRAPATQDELREELFRFGQGLQSNGFRVRFAQPGGVSYVTWYQDEAARLRLDLDERAPDGSGRLRTFIDDGSNSFSCREPGVCTRGTELFDEGSQQQTLEALGSVFLYSFYSLGQGPVFDDLTRTTQRIAGVKGICFKTVKPGEFAQEFCFGERGAPLRLAWFSPELGEIGARFEAQEVSYEVTDNDFVPPYPLTQ